MADYPSAAGGGRIRLLEDRDDLEWLVAVGRNKNGEIFFYDTGGDIVEDLGTLEYLKQRIIRAHFGDEPE